MKMMKPVRRLVAAMSTLALAAGVHAAGTIGTTLPADFPVIADASLGTPVIGFGAAGPVQRTPVIFLHGNNDTPFPTACSGYPGTRAMAQYLANQGYSASELWGLGYQGDQCDLRVDNARRAGPAHTTAANVPDLRRFVQAVLDYTSSKEVDIVAHSLGVTLTREWMRQDHAQRLVRRFVAIDGPNRGIINCSPSALNYYQLVAFGGFTPQSAVCQELGSPNTPFLRRLNAGSETPGSTRILVIRNADTSFVYFAQQDGFFTPVPALDMDGQPTDFSQSATLRGSRQLDLVAQGQYDPGVLKAAHIGILYSPQTWQAALEFLADPSPRR